MATQLSIAPERMPLDIMGTVIFKGLDLGRTEAYRRLFYAYRYLHQCRRCGAYRVRHTAYRKGHNHDGHCAGESNGLGAVGDEQCDTYDGAGHDVGSIAMVSSEWLSALLRRNDKVSQKHRYYDDYRQRHDAHDESVARGEHELFLQRALVVDKRVPHAEERSLLLRKLR